MSPLAARTLVARTLTVQSSPEAINEIYRFGSPLYKTGFYSCVSIRSVHSQQLRRCPAFSVAPRAQA